jgi:hypothetical protein
LRKSQVKAAVAAAFAVPAVIIAVATPAGAVASAQLSPANCGYNHTCVGYAQDVVGVGTGTDVFVSCTAAGTASVQATIVRCYIKGNTGDIHYTNPVLTQGNASTLTHTFDAWSLQSRTYTICVGAGYYSNSGTYFAPTNYKCGSAV